MLWDEIDKAGCSNSLHSGIVLTGGGACLDGMAEIAEQIFDLPVRRGVPAGAAGLGDQASSPIYATAVGAVMYASRNRPVVHDRKQRGFGRIAELVSSMFREFFIGR
jgi:cell division protein FtsA